MSDYSLEITQKYNLIPVLRNTEIFWFLNMLKTLKYIFLNL